MIAEKLLELKEIQAISHKMFALAEVNNWQKLPDLEKERKNIMNSFFSSEVTMQDSSEVKKVIQDVLLINDKITELAEESKRTISLQRQNIKKRQNVHSAYLQNN